MDSARFVKAGAEGLRQFFQFRQHSEQVADEADIGDLEDRRLRVLVDRDDGASVLDAGQVLDGAGNADRHVQFRRDDLAGLADLQLIGHVAGVDRRARGADRCAELVGELVDDLEVLRRADAAAAGDHALGALQVGAVGLARSQADEAGVAGQRRVDAGRFDRRATALRRFRPRGAAHGGDHDLVGRGLQADDGVAGVDRSLERVVAVHRHQVGDLVDAEQGGHHRHQVLAEGGGGAEHVGVALRQGSDLRAQHLRDGVFVGGVGDGEDAGDAGDLRGLGSHRGRIGRQHHDVDGLGRQRLRGADALGGGGVELPVEMFGDDEDLGHYSNPFCLSAATSSAASLTITPRLRLAGGA